MNYETEQKPISIPIPAKFRDTALEFAQEQPNQSKAKQVYLNTLAVQVVDSYLKMLDIPTNLEASYSWDSWGRILADTADLILPGIGHLECRYLRTGDSSCYVPGELWENRFSYLFIEVNKSCTEAKIIGFLPQVNSQEVNLAQLQTLDDFLEYYHQYSIVKLRQWLEGIYTSKWQNIEDFSQSQYREREIIFRTLEVRGLKIDTPNQVWDSIKQIYTQEKIAEILPSQLLAKVNSQSNSETSLTETIIYLLQNESDEETRWTLAEILKKIAPHHPLISARRMMDLGMQLGGNAVGLMVALLPNKNQTFSILLRVYPIGEKTYLPTGLKLSGLYENGQPFLETEARKEKDNYIQLKFCAELGEKFQIRVKIGDVSITERFII